jgi:hypothetical protein
MEARYRSLTFVADGYADEFTFPGGVTHAPVGRVELWRRVAAAAP